MKRAGGARYVPTGRRGISDGFIRFSPSVTHPRATSLLRGRQGEFVGTIHELSDLIGRCVAESLHHHSVVPLPLGKGGFVGYGIYDVPII